MQTPNLAIVVMGVAGAGKTTIGQQLAHRLNCPFFDADDYHPPENVAKMSAGTPLSDEDRLPWLEQLSALLSTQKNEGIVLACSALKSSYRSILAKGNPDIRWGWLDGPLNILIERLEGRKNHFMPVSLLQDQLNTLEPPTEACKVSILLPPEEQIASIMHELKPPLVHPCPTTPATKS